MLQLAGVGSHLAEASGEAAAAAAAEGDAGATGAAGAAGAATIPGSSTAAVEGEGTIHACLGGRIHYKALMFKFVIIHSYMKRFALTCGCTQLLAALIIHFTI